MWRFGLGKGQCWLISLDVLLLAPVASTAEWKRQPCGCVNGQADLVTRWGATVDALQTPLPEYPRPQLTRTCPWLNLNGLWQWEPASETTQIDFGRDLNNTILVPFPPESCLSGLRVNHQWMMYRRLVDRPDHFMAGAPTILRFGAVDWIASVYFNGAYLGNHTGGYSEFNFDGLVLRDRGNEIIVKVYDPSELGPQPFGKQRAASITAPGTHGNRYTPTSGIWQTVWFEQAPSARLERLRIVGNTTAVTVSAEDMRGVFNGILHVNISIGGTTVATSSAKLPSAVHVAVPSPHLWSPSDPFLYNVSVTLLASNGTIFDRISSYVGLRNVSLGPAPDNGPIPATRGLNWPGGDFPNMPIKLNATATANVCEHLCNMSAGCAAWAYGLPNCGHQPAKTPECWLKSTIIWSKEQRSNVCRISGTSGTQNSRNKTVALYLNGAPVFAAGWLDQSWWPDGQYTAPTDDALSFDIQAVKMFGLNTVRLHQKINPERWYWHADRLGVLVLQDAVQHFEYKDEPGAEGMSTKLFQEDWKAAIEGRVNHPSIIQWNIFNEFEYEPSLWNATEILDFTRALDPTRLVDFNSGGPGNNLHIGDVNDIHTYPYPGNPTPLATQYAEIGEYGGIGWRPVGKEWLEDSCGKRAIISQNSSDGAAVLLNMIKLLSAQRDAGTLSAAIITQITDVELECDGLLAYDRSHHFAPRDIESIRAAYANLTRPFGVLAQQGGVSKNHGEISFDACASSDSHLKELRDTICSSLVGPGTPWCDPGSSNVSSDKDWPSQVTYMQALLDTIPDSSTCLNTTYALDTVQWINTVQGNANVSGTFMNTWVDFQVQYYDMPRKPGARIESPGTLGRKCWAFAYLQQLWKPQAIMNALQKVGLNLTMYAASADSAITLTISLCEQVMANCFVNATYDPTRNGTCSLKIDEFKGGFIRENLKRKNIIQYPFQP